MLRVEDEQYLKEAVYFELITEMRYQIEVGFGSKVKIVWRLSLFKDFEMSLCFSSFTLHDILMSLLLEADWI